jgi:hypothetical protein
MLDIDSLAQVLRYIQIQSKGRGRYLRVTSAGALFQVLKIPESKYIQSIFMVNYWCFWISCKNQINGSDSSST